MSDSIITSPHSIQQSHYSHPKTPELQELLAETSRWLFNDLAETGQIKHKTTFLPVTMNCSQHFTFSDCQKGAPVNRSPCRKQSSA